MITDILDGDITSPKNRRDIIIGMNPGFEELSALGHRFLGNVVPLDLMKLGSVLTFDFDGERRLHMLICHLLGHGGWEDADKFVRSAMDHLWQSDGARQYSIVKIGGGAVGKRYGADQGAIITAMATSHLPVVLYTRPTSMLPYEVSTEPSPRLFLNGLEPLPHVAAAA